MVEAALFRSGWYNQYLEPLSSTGTLELQLHFLQKTRPLAPQIMVLGDSRIAEGFSARRASELSSGRYYFWNEGIPGSTPRVWYYFLRDADPTRRRFRTIAITLDRYDDTALYDSLPDRLMDLSFVIGRLRIDDIWSFAHSYKTPASVQTALVGGSLKGAVYRRDLIAFLIDMPKRLKSVHDWRKDGLDYYFSYGGRDGNLAGLTVDFAKRKVTFPPGVDQEQRDSVSMTMVPDFPPQTGQLTNYRRRWLGAIIQMYRDSPTKLVFLEGPRGPLPTPTRSVPPNFINWARTQPHVIVLDATTFRNLERPDLFFDGLHLNRQGREIFSERLEQQLAILSAKQ